MCSWNGSTMTNNPICFVCGATGAGCYISTKPQKSGAYFSFLATHTPPDGANMPDSNGFVSACVVCKACLTEQWNSYERHKTPLVERIFWMKRIDDHAFTGAEISIQGDFVAQYIGTNSNGLSIDEKLDHSSHDANKLRRKPTGASFSGMVIDPEETSSSCDDASRVLDLSTSPRKNSPNKLSTKSTQGFKTLSNIKPRHTASERKLRSRNNSVQSASTFVCYICRGLFGSPQKSRFLSCTYSSDDEPYFPFVQTLTRPEGAKEITKSGLAEVCCDCRKTLSRQWRVFETRNVPVEKRVYDIESLIYSSQLGINNNNNNININKNQNFLGDSKNDFSKSGTSPEELPRCFACSQTSNSLENISDLFLRGKSENVISLLPLSKKLLERKNSSISHHSCCKKCSQILFLESRVLEESLETTSKVSVRPRNFAAERESRKGAGEESPAPAEGAGGRLPRLASDFSPSSSDSSRDCVSPSKRNEARPSPLRVCFVCRHDLEDCEISTSSQKASVILCLANLMPSSSGDVELSSELRICEKCSGYLLPSLLKDSKHLPLRKEFLNGEYDSSRRLVCFYCSSKEETTGPGFVSVGIGEDAKSQKIKNLSLLGVKEINVCRRCRDKRNNSATSKRRLSKSPNDEGNTKARKVERSDGIKEPLHLAGHELCEENELSTVEAAAGIIGGCVSQRESATGHKRIAVKMESTCDDDDDDDDDDDKEVQRNKSQGLNSRILTSQNKNNKKNDDDVASPNTSKCHRPIETSSDPLHGPVSIFKSFFDPSASVFSSVPLCRLPPAFSPRLTVASRRPPHDPTDHLDSRYFVHYQTVNRLLAGRNRDGDVGTKDSTLNGQTKCNGNLPEDPSRSAGRNFCEVDSEATRPDDFVSKSSFYRPFSDNESLPRTDTRGSPRLSDRQFSIEGRKLEASPFPLESVSLRSDFPPSSDERLTAALGLISLCRSRFPKEKLANGERSPGAVSSIREGEGRGIADPKNIPQSETGSSDRFPQGTDSEASGIKAAARNGVSIERLPASPDRPTAKVIHWPGVNAIVESYNNYFADLSSERKILRSVRRNLFDERAELISRGRNFQTTLKLLVRERESLEESGRRTAEQLSKLKSCLNI